MKSNKSKPERSHQKQEKMFVENPELLDRKDEYDQDLNTAQVIRDKFNKYLVMQWIKQVTHAELLRARDIHDDTIVIPVQRTDLGKFIASFRKKYSDEALYDMSKDEIEEKAKSHWNTWKEQRLYF